jgi:hypothetical protein
VQNFTATVTNATDTRVSWLVNDVPGGNSTFGTITAAGLYSAPATRPSPSSVTVKAVSVADPAIVATATVTIAPPAPINSGGGGGGGGGGGRFDFALVAVLAFGVLARRLKRV